MLLRAKCIVVLAGASFCFQTSPVTALDIEFIEIGTTPMTTIQRTAFEQAAQFWEEAFLDPITVDINIGFDDSLETHVIGGTRSAMITTTLPVYIRAARLSATPGQESAALGMIPTPTVPIIDINGPRDAPKVTLTTANAKALGLDPTSLDPLYGDALPNRADASILFNPNFSFDYDRTDGIGAGLKDFVTVAAHEIGHSLGFVSMTDVQDANPTFMAPPFRLYPSPLDLWRFSATGNPHSLSTETRMVTAGPAEYYDGILDNVEFSYGLGAADLQCHASGNRCQASHWRDYLPYLMKPTLADETSIDLGPQDLHALDFVGWEQPTLQLGSRLRVPPLLLRVGWFSLGSILPDFGGAFDSFASPPDEMTLPTANLDFEPNVAIRLGIDFGLAGQTARSGLGVARIEDALPNPNAVVLQPVQNGDPDHTIQLPAEPMTLIPPRITGFMFLSDDSQTQFLFTDAFGDSGAMFDPSLGEFGGYRISGFVHGYGDNVPGDDDGMMTFLLLADNPSGLPDLVNDSLFHLAVAEDNGLLINDPAALGIYFPPGDYNRNGEVDAADFVIWRDSKGQQGSGLAADGSGPNGGPDGVVNDWDYRFWRANFGATAAGVAEAAATDHLAAVPEPAGPALCPVVVATLGPFWRRRRSRAAGKEADVMDGT